ncbi:MAG: multiheme c-type cytochrome [Bradymonadaceae bacterium]
MGGAEALPGEAEAGERQPEDVGPEAPGIFFMAGLKGYLEPCGCSADVLLGGAERIVGYVQAARELYPDSLMLDAGDMLFERAELEDHKVPQAKAKTDVIVAMQKALGTKVTVPGERDFALGPELYLDKIEQTGAEIVAANLTINGNGYPGAKRLEVGDWQLGVVGAVDPALYEGVEGVQASEIAGAVREALGSLEETDAVVALFHGGLNKAKELLEAHDAIDFIVVGHDPRETDQVDEVNNGYTLEAYDQGRYVGILKLFGSGKLDPFANAKTGSESELENINRQIAHVEESIEELPPAPPGEGPAVLKRLRERLDELEARRREINHADLEVAEDQKSFLYRPVPMKPGYPIAKSIREKRVAFNAELEDLNRQVDRQVPPVPEGEATNQCATCHSKAHDFWKGTLHAKALETLQKRDKAWDQECIGCHVVGYEKPGGSVLGKLKYKEKVDGQTLTKNLQDVGCENCHGPGSKHRAQPDGKPQYIDDGTGKQVCKQCHVPEHSPRFNYETYVDKITGEGHERSSK